MADRMSALARNLRSTRAWRIVGLPYRASRAARAIAPDIAAAFRWLATSREDTNYTYPVTDRSLRQLSHMLAMVTGATPAEVRSYFDEIRNDEELARHVIEGTRRHYPSVSDRRADYGRRMGWYALVRITKPRVVVETGVDKGLGSVVLAAALLRNGSGRLYGTELRRDRGKLLTGKYAEVGEILFGDSIETLADFPHEIDLFVNDSDHSGEYEYREYRTIADKLSDRAIIVADNAEVTDCAERFSEETGRRFIFWKEESARHWYRGGGIGLSY